MADCLSRWAYPAGKAWMDISSHGDAEETEEAKRIIEMEKAMEQEGVKCFVVRANHTDLAKFRAARVQAIGEETLEQWMVAPVELVRWCSQRTGRMTTRHPSIGASTGMP